MSGITSGPQDNWTVEEAFQWVASELKKQVDDDFEAEIKPALLAQMNEGIKEIWELQSNIINNPENVKPNVPPFGNVGLKDVKPATLKESSPAISASSSSSSSSKKYSSLRVVIVEGLYKGQCFDLEPTLRFPCFIGRSKGQKFKNRGLSLPKDLELSTSHGKFELGEDGAFYFTDTGSTNGSFYGTSKEEIEPHAPKKLNKGDLLTCGGTVIQIFLS